MEKALLKVNRFNNTDVIATSGVDPTPDPIEYCTKPRIYFVNGVNESKNFISYGVFDYSETTGTYSHVYDNTGIFENGLKAKNFYHDLSDPNSICTKSHPGID